MKSFFISMILSITLAAFAGDKGGEIKVLNFMKENPDKMALTLIKNGKELININNSLVMPLASTVKILVAIEYAEQAAEGKINPDKVVLKEELDLYYIPKTDGGAHPRWLENLGNKPITLREVAKGMIRFSSNANTEYLCDLLGLANINLQREKLGLSNHTDVYNIVSALFVGKELYPDLKEKDKVEKLKNLSIEDYINASETIHKKLKTDSNYKNELGKMNLDLQRLWSDNLPASTTSDYASIMQKLNAKQHFSEEVYLFLDEVMEQVMNNPANQSWLKHSGTKGGSTAFVLTKALYATDKEGNTTELALFFNNLKVMENLQLQMGLNDFELSLLTQPEFVEKMIKELE